MKDIRHSFWGYNSKDVQETLESLQEELRRLRAENTNQVRQLEELNTQLRRVKADEELIREAIVDAKHLSKRLVREAKEQATEILFEAEKDISDQFSQFETSMSTLNSLREQLTQQKAQLEQELKDTIERYRRGLAEAETGAFERLNQEMVDTFEQVEEASDLSKQVILLPKDATSDGMTPALSKFLERDNDWGDDVPIYSFQ